MVGSDQVVSANASVRHYRNLKKRLDKILRFCKIAIISMILRRGHGNAEKPEGFYID
jgi:hypothetical protein